jgi:hypothetical protein
MNTNLQHHKVAAFRAGLQLFSTRGAKCQTMGLVLAAIISTKASYLAKSRSPDYQSLPLPDNLENTPAPRQLRSN